MNSTVGSVRIAARVGRAQRACAPPLYPVLARIWVDRSLASRLMIPTFSGVSRSLCEFAALPPGFDE
jgi:hypothetical protein